ncbi:hypothetical protein MTO96_011972 [Rhipicephalus appendiculatus]
MAEPSEAASLSRVESAQASCLRPAFGLSSGAAVFLSGRPLPDDFPLPGRLVTALGGNATASGSAVFGSLRCFHLSVFASAASFSVTQPPVVSRILRSTARMRSPWDA